MADEPRFLTDQELQAIFKNSQADLSLLSPDEHTRLLKLTGAGSPSDAGALGLAEISPTLRTASRLTTEFATNPSVPKTSAAIGRVIGGVAPVIAGAAEGGPVGALVGVAASSKGAWAGGKTGWFTGKLAQNMSAPVASALQKVTPYLQAVSTVSGAQGALDLAQMAEPSRKDIGFLGLSIEQPRSTDEQKAHPALLNLLAMKALALRQRIMDQLKETQPNP